MYGLTILNAIVYGLHFNSGNVKRILSILKICGGVSLRMASFSTSYHNVHEVENGEIVEGIYTSQWLALLSVVLREGLKHCFKSVEVNVVPCPDLTASPFGLLLPGLAGQNVVCDVGSMAYLLPVADTSKVLYFHLLLML